MVSASFSMNSFAISMMSLPAVMRAFPDSARASKDLVTG